MPESVSSRSFSRVGGCAPRKRSHALAQQFGAGLGQAHLAGTAVKQQHIQRFLHLAHPVRQGTWHQTELPRGGGEAALVLDGLEHSQGVGRQDIACALHLGLS